MAKLKIGVVPYMNAKPFIYGFQEKADEVDIVYGVPSALPQMLENDELDIILMPSVGYFQRYRLQDYSRKLHRFKRSGRKRKACLLKRLRLTKIKDCCPGQRLFNFLRSHKDHSFEKTFIET